MMYTDLKYSIIHWKNLSSKLKLYLLKFILRAFFSFLNSRFFYPFFSIDIFAKSLDLSCFTEDFKWFQIIFNLKKLRLPDVFSYN